MIESLTSGKPHKELSKVDRLLLNTMGSQFAKGAKIKIRRQSRTLFSQRVEDNAFHLSIYVLISGGGWSSVMPVSMP